MSIEVENNVELPEEPKKKPRARRTAKPAQDAAGLNLLAALKFVAQVVKKTNEPHLQYCMIVNKWVAATNGLITLGTRIEEDLTAWPNVSQFIDALSKCGQELNITQLSDKELSLKSGDFKALIECTNGIPIDGPDEQVITIDDEIKKAVAAVVNISNENSDNTNYRIVLLQANTAAATNGHCLIEAWHGVDLPKMLIPKAAALILAKTDKELSGFGYSVDYATFYFKDGSFLKTFLYKEKYVNYERLFRNDISVLPLPDNFFKAVKAIESFSEGGIVYFENGFVSSREKTEKCTTYAIEGLPSKMGFQAKYFTILEASMKKAYFDQTMQRCFFFGDKTRGIIMGVNMPKDEPEDPIPF